MWQHAGGKTTVVSVERIEVDAMAMREEFMQQLPPLPVREAVQPPPKKNPLNVKKTKRRRKRKGKR